MRIVRNNGEKGNVFDKHFRELRNSEVPPPGDLWDRIEYTLDEDRQRVKHDHWYHALLLLLIPLTAINIYLTYDLQGLYVSFFKKGTDEYAAHHNALASAEILSPSLPSERDYASIPFVLNKSELVNTIPPRGNQFSTIVQTGSLETHTAITAGNAVALSENIFENERVREGNEELQNVAPEHSPIPVERLMLETSLTPQDVKFAHAKNEHVRKQSAVKGFHVGIEGGLNHSMVLMKESNLDPIIGSNVHRKLNPGAYYAVSMGYDFSRKFGIETELIFCSKQGQKYSELRYGKIPIDGEITLEYMSVPLLFKYKMTTMGGKSLNPRALNFIAGLQYSRLKEAKISLNDLDIKNATQPFNRDELGFVLGLEYDIFFSPNYFLTLGTRASISSDIHAFPYFVPQASQTYNVLVGVNASFHYLMKRR